jgi:hypothetical protein
VSLELVPGATDPGAPRVDPELQAFNQAATQNSAAGWDSYLKAYPAGRYANLARVQRDDIRARGTAGTQSAAATDPPQAAVRDEAVSRQDEVEGDSKMYEAISIALCLKNNCLNYSVAERQRQTALAQRDCVVAKKQWRSALDKTTSAQRALALKPKIEGNAIQCRKDVGCSSTGWPAYNYIAPEGGDIQMIPGFHCSDTDPL